MNKLIFAIVMFFSPTANGYDFAPEIEPFYKRYEKADLIALGELTSESVGNSNIKDFQGLEKAWIKKKRLRVIETFKGPKLKFIEFFAYCPEFVRPVSYGDLKEEDLSRASKASGVTVIGDRYIVFLHKEAGQYFSEYGFGLVRINNRERLEDKREYHALKDLAAGKTMDIAVSHLDPNEKKAYELQSK